MSGKMNIKVSLRDYKSEEESKVRAFASVMLVSNDSKSSITITNVPVVEKESKSGTKFLDYYMPTRSREDENGERKFSNLAELSSKDESRAEKLRIEIQDAIRKAYLGKCDENGLKHSQIESGIEVDMNNVMAYTRQATSEKNPNLKGFLTAYIGDVIKLNNISVTEGINNETGEIFTAINFPTNGPDKDGNYHDITFTTGDIKNKIKEIAELDMALQEQANKVQESKEDSKTQKSKQSKQSRKSEEIQEEKEDEGLEL